MQKHKIFALVFLCIKLIAALHPIRCTRHKHWWLLTQKMSVASSSLSTIEMAESTFWGGEATNICEVEPCTPPRIERQKMSNLLESLDIHELDKFLIAWSDRKYSLRMQILNAEIENLLYDILDSGHKEYVLNSLIDKIATAKDASELNVPLWSYTTTEYDEDQEGTSWADKPYAGFDTMAEWIRNVGYETYISASNVTVHSVITETAALTRLAGTFNDEYFIVRTVKTLQGSEGPAHIYNVKLILEFWPGSVPLWRKY